MLQRWRAIGNTVSDLTSPRFKIQTSRSTIIEYFSYGIDTNDSEQALRMPFKVKHIAAFLDLVCQGDTVFKLWESTLRIFPNGAE